jgi:aspartyl-tRNA synthetase
MYLENCHLPIYGLWQRNVRQSNPIPSLLLVYIPPATKRNNVLTPEDIDQTHTLQGWLIIPKRKVSKELQFLQLRDSEGNILQLYSSNEIPTEIYSESPVSVTGIIRRRPESQRREGLGEYELEISQIHPLNAVKFTLPFQPSQSQSINAATRAKYRYLELRNSVNHSYLRLRDEIVASCRNFLRNDEGFMEIETPLLFKSTPEGAREFIVPTRRKGEVYALPQSPQQYKQILMASGIDRYFQVAKCFRDEDLRADRQPEFTQVCLLK